MPRAKKDPSKFVFQLKITLRGSKPPIWRRVLVTENTTFAELHDIIQIAMGWTDSHLHAFEVDGEPIGIPDPEEGFEVLDSSKLKLRQFVGEKSKFSYLYDFGDSWDHIIVVEKVLPVEPGKQYPVCLTGKRACPPEDCGGIWGYGDLLEILANPRHPEHKSMKTWVGGKFDPEHFDLNEVNQVLNS
ncbi:MAG: plasmid pRiA4b ORF-3 family protein [Blastocatellia bacterium]|nr:plasmid pRiA4b ORF-3 family protein [Blastocatellia bacterium]